MKLIEITSEEILTLFLGKKIEQPFRHQPDVGVVLRFREYLQLVKVVVTEDLRVFSPKLDVYREALRNEDNTLYKYFYYDVAELFAWELILSYESHKPCTKFYCKFDTGDSKVISARAIRLKMENESINSAQYSSLRGLFSQFQVDCNKLNQEQNEALGYIMHLWSCASKRDFEKIEIGGF